MRAARPFDLEHRFGEGIGKLLRSRRSPRRWRPRRTCAAADRRGVLGLDLRIALLRLAGDALRLAQEVARDVDDMDAEIEDDEALLVVEIGLARVDVIAGAEADPRPGRFADHAGIEDRLHLLKRRLEAEVLVHGEKEPGLVGGLDDGDAILPLRREGLLHDRRHLVAEGELGQRAMRIHAGDDVDEAELLGGKHRLGVGVPARYAEGLGGRLCLRSVDVADGDEVGALGLEVLPGIQVIAGKEAAADNPDRNPPRHSRSSRFRRWIPPAGRRESRRLGA